MRDIAPVTQTALTQRVLRPILAVDLEFPSGHVRLHTGHGNLTIGGQTFLGAGTFGGMSAIEENAGDVSSSGVNFTLSGIPSSYISALLGEHYQGREVSAYVVLLDGAASVIGNPFRCFKGKIDSPSLTESEETVSISLSAESDMADLRRPLERRYTAEDQSRHYPTDTGFRFISAMQNKTLMWGRPYQAGETGGSGGGSGGIWTGAGSNTIS